MAAASFLKTKRRWKLTFSFMSFGGAPNRHLYASYSHTGQKKGERQRQKLGISIILTCLSLGRADVKEKEEKERRFAIYIDESAQWLSESRPHGPEFELAVSELLFLLCEWQVLRSTSFKTWLERICLERRA